MLTNERMAVRTAKSLVAFLESKGIETKTDYAYKPIRKILRECWYVKKLVECGQTECIHIDLPKCGSFLVITNDCKLMTGFHVMINDAIQAIYYEYDDSDCGHEPYDTVPYKRCKYYGDEDWGDCGMTIMEPYVFRNWVDSLTFYDDEDSEEEF